MLIKCPWKFIKNWNIEKKLTDRSILYLKLIK